MLPTTATVATAAPDAPDVPYSLESESVHLRQPCHSCLTLKSVCTQDKRVTHDLLCGVCALDTAMPRQPYWFMTAFHPILTKTP